MLLSGEFRGEVAVLAIGYLAAKAGIRRIEHEVHDLERDLEPSIATTTPSLVQARPVDLLMKLKPVADDLHAAQEPSWIAHLEKSNPEKLIAPLNDAGLVQENQGRRVIRRQARPI